MKFTPWPERVKLVSETNCYAILRALCRDPNPYVRAAIVQRQDCPASIIDILCHDPCGQIVCRALRHPNCPKERIAEALTHEDPFVQTTAIELYRGDVQRLVDLVQGDARYAVRSAVVKHPLCPPEALSILVESKEFEIVIQALRHPNCTIEIVEKAANGPHSVFVRRWFETQLKQGSLTAGLAELI